MLKPYPAVIIGTSLCALALIVNIALFIQTHTIVCALSGLTNIGTIGYALHVLRKYPRG